MKRSLSITLVALAQLGISTLSLVSGSVLILLMTGQIEIFSADLTHLPDYFKALVIFGLIVSVLGIVAAYGLWQLQRWGWMASLVFQGLCILNNVLILLGGRPLTLGVYFSAGISGALLFALLLPSVRLSLQGSPLPETSQSSS
jgi:hypothetical protein